MPEAAAESLPAIGTSAPTQNVLLWPLPRLPIVNVTGLVPLTLLMVAVPGDTVKLVSDPARPVGEPKFPTRTWSVLLLHAIVTSARLLEVLRRTPVPLNLVIAPVLGATRKTVLPDGADTTVPRSGVDVVIDCTV